MATEDTNSGKTLERLMALLVVLAVLFTAVAVGVALTMV